jgi:hypothetical protein
MPALCWGRGCVFAGVIAGVSPLHPTRGRRPLDPIQGAFFNVTLSEGVQRGFAPLQVQDGVLRFFRGLCSQGRCPCTPQGDVVPLTPFKGHFLM